MNRNIEVINENLWAVNSSFVRMGYIQELKPLLEQSDNPYVSLTNDGIMVLKKESGFYPILKKFLVKIMGRTDEQLEYAQQKMKMMEMPDAYEKMYLNVLEWEIKRRYVKTE